MNVAGPAVHARHWRRFADIVAGRIQGDVAYARREMARIERRCPDVASRCSACGHRLASNSPHGPRCAARLERAAA